MIPLRRGPVAASALSVVVLAAAAAYGPAALGGRASHSGTAYPLYTHCGIYELQVDTAFYAADHPLDDGNGNPPAGWGNPYQPGWVSTPTPSTAVFTDLAGHTVGFHVRVGATGFQRPCS